MFSVVACLRRKTTPTEIEYYVIHNDDVLSLVGYALIHEYVFCIYKRSSIMCDEVFRVTNYFERGDRYISQAHAHVICRFASVNGTQAYVIATRIALVILYTT